MSTDPSEHPDPVDPERLTQWYGEYSERLRAFAWGLLGDHHLVEEVLQATFAAASRKGGSVATGAVKSWLYRVAFNEAMQHRRRAEVDRRSLEEYSKIKLNEVRASAAGAGLLAAPAADFELLRWETVQAVRNALSELPSSQREVVRLRMERELTFAEIAVELSLPLGTVLTRMRLAVEKLRRALADSGE